MQTDVVAVADAAAGGLGVGGTARQADGGGAVAAEARPLRSSAEQIRASRRREVPPAVGNGAGAPGVEAATTVGTPGAKEEVRGEAAVGGRTKSLLGAAEEEEGAFLRVEGDREEGSPGLPCQVSLP